MLVTSRRTRSPIGAVHYLVQDQVGSQPAFRRLANALLKSAIVVRHASTFLTRASQLAFRIHPGLGALVKQMNHVWTGADISPRAEIGCGLVLHHPTGVVVGPEVLIGQDCRIQQGVTLGGRGGRKIDGNPVLGDRVHLGAGSRVLGNVRIGDDVTIGANAVVLSDVPSNSIAVGIPAKVISR